MEKKVFKFNWAGVEKAANGKCKEIVSLIGILSGHKKNFSRKEYKQAIEINKLEKHSFALNIIDLLEDRRSTVQDKCLALFLGAKRNYVTYLTNNDSSLPLLIVEDILDVNKLKNNPLISIEGDFIKLNIN